MVRESIKAPQMTLGEKAWKIHWMFVLLICCISAIGVTMLYSAGNGNLAPWASRQLLRFVAGLAALMAVALIDIRVWLRHAYVIYILTLALLGAAELAGSARMGAQRWIELGFFTIQPSEIMKLTIVLALARYFHGCSIEDVGRLRNLIVPLFIVVAPAALVMRQPDLGTALILVFVSAGLMFLAGVKVWKFVAVGIAATAAVPVAWQFLRHYQKQRVLTFFDPESDPLGTGYHIIQSKIALGSGGLFGKGLLQGSQSHLSFLPEMHTDFIFTMLAEEFGLTGGLFLLTLYTLVLIYGIVISLRCRSQFGQLVGMGVTLTFFLYVFINISMVMGMVPVVGVPLPLISYGGTAMVTALIGFGLLMNVCVHRDVEIGRSGAVE